MAFWYWFMFVTHPGVEPTSNRAERAKIAGHVVQRKIVGTAFVMEKGRQFMSGS